MSLVSLAGLAKFATLRTPRMDLRNWLRADLDIMSAWPQFTLPAEKFLNLNIVPLAGRDTFFLNRNNDRTRRNFTIIRREDNILLGRLTLREIDLNTGTALLGIYFPPPYVNQGYGTEILSAFLHVYFHQASLKALYLSVLALNPRAIACYLKLGFREIGNNWDFRVPTSEIAFNEQPEFASWKPYIRPGPFHFSEILSLVMVSDQCHCHACSYFQS